MQTKEDGNVSSWGRNQAAKHASVGALRGEGYSQVPKLASIMNNVMKSGPSWLMEGQGSPRDEDLFGAEIPPRG